MPERSWGECNHGKALTQNGLARRLKPFDIFTKGIGPEQKRVKGYTLESFADAFKRYLPPIATAQPHSSNENNDLDEKQTAQPVYDCAVANEPNTLNANDLCGCADENPQNGDACECADDLPPGDRENSVNGGLEENEASPTQSRQAIARALMREANRQGADLHLDKNGDLKRREVPLDPAFLMKLKEFKLQIIATLQNGGGWNDRS
jgi:Protein of unknown function (DUF3631)